jgi:hypothetical protein
MEADLRERNRATARSAESVESAPQRPAGKRAKTAARSRSATASARGRGRRVALGPPTHDEIAVRAYELYAQSGGEHGRHVDHWLEAERQLRRECGLEV